MYLYVGFISHNFQWGHVFSDMEISSARKQMCRAASSGLQWGHVFSDMEIAHRARRRRAKHSLASMGPRLFRHGNLTLPFGLLDQCLPLQWGHVFSDMEMKSVAEESLLPRTRFNGATSFQTWKSANSSCDMSMKTLLQWGHVFSDMEMARYNLKRPTPSQLQWGHVFSDMEIGQAGGKRGSSAPCFNGATSFQTWK